MEQSSYGQNQHAISVLSSSVKLKLIQHFTTVTLRLLRTVEPDQILHMTPIIRYKDLQRHFSLNIWSQLSKCKLQTEKKKQFFFLFQSLMQWQCICFPHSIPEIENQNFLT